MLIHRQAKNVTDGMIETISIWSVKLRSKTINSNDFNFISWLPQIWFYDTPHQVWYTPQNMPQPFHAILFVMIIWPDSIVSYDTFVNIHQQSCFNDCPRVSDRTLTDIDKILLCQTTTKHITRWNTVQCCYNAVSFLPNPHNIHPIARVMGCLLWG